MRGLDSIDLRAIVGKIIVCGLTSSPCWADVINQHLEVFGVISLRELQRFFKHLDLDEEKYPFVLYNCVHRLLVFLSSQSFVGCTVHGMLYSLKT